jgi:putative ABC transport system permease protein
MAFRNIFEHKSKSLIIGILLAMGSLILIVGNSFIDASRTGIEITFSDNYTGDVFISGISPEGPVSLFGVTSVGGLAATPVIPDFDKVLSILKQNPHVDAFSGMATGYGIVTKNPELSIDQTMQEVDEEADSSESDPSFRFFFLFGVDPSSYWTMFDSVLLTSGSLIKPGSTGLVVNEKQLEKISKWMKKPLGVGDTLVIQGFSAAGMKIRELPILGTYVQQGEGAAPEQMTFVDIDTLRILAGMTVGSNEDIVLTEDQYSLLGEANEGDLFGGDLFDDDLIGDSPAKGSFDETKIQAQLANTKARELANTADTGAWQFLVIKAKDPAKANSLIKELNLALKDEGIEAIAGDWQKAAGPYGQSVDVIRIVFTIAIAILSIVAIIIIMNTFVISVIERTGEIGTMRAIGAQRVFVRKLFAAESVVLSLVFSIIGALLAVGVVALLRSLKIEAGNPFLAVLFGGKYLSPYITVLNFIGGIVGMVAVGYVAHLYPVSVALRIKPVQAMRND